MAAHPLVMVEVIPLMNVTSNLTYEDTNNNKDDDDDGRKQSFRNTPTISAPSAKLQLLNMSRHSMFSKGWLGTGEVEGVHSKKNRGNRKGIAGDRMKNDNMPTSQETSPTQSRGLLLNPDMQSGHICICCQNKSQPTKSSGNKFDGNTMQHHNNNAKTIIAGDLIFQGNDAAHIHTDTKNHTESSKCNITPIPVTYLRSNDPLDDKGVPCHLRGYIFANKQCTILDGVCCCYCQMTKVQCRTTSGTVVQIRHPVDIDSIHNNRTSLNADFLHQVLSGRQNVSLDAITSSRDAESEFHYSKLSCYSKETIESLSLRMSTMLANTVWIGTTPNALSSRKTQEQKLELMELEIDLFCKAHPSKETYTTTKVQRKQRNVVPLLLREGALLVYNSYSSSGKTTLVTEIAKDILKCHAVHVISSPSLFAKYGTSADAALEMLLHELALRCAVKGGASGEVAKVCIILDHLETFLPLSSQSGGDPYLPVLHAMGEIEI